MNTQPFPPLPLAGWRPTRDTIHIYSRFLGKVRGSLTPPQKHWWHISLRVVEKGLTTPPITIPGSELGTFEMTLNLVDHQFVIHTNSDAEWRTSLSGQAPRLFHDQALAALHEMGIQPKIDASLFAGEEPCMYDARAAETFLKALRQIDQIFKQFKTGLPGETSPVQLWPHHFDLALMWLPGTKVPGVNPADEEYADQQMAFGFSTGDEGIPDPYFYITAYPWPEAILERPLPAGAVWHTTNWKGGLLMYQALTQAFAPEEQLLEFLRAGFQAGSSLLTS